MKSNPTAIVLSTAYLGPVGYFARLVQADEVIIEHKEHYIKQTWRNRCRIMTANGPLNLIIPVVKINGHHTKTGDVEISYTEKWQQLHWRAILAAYTHSPYFLFYRDALEPFYTKRFEKLFDFNQQLLFTIFKLIGVDKKIRITSEFRKEWPDGYIDLRNAFKPGVTTGTHNPPYMQVFEARHGFVPDLSILDLLLNLGPDTKVYLMRL